MILQESAQMYLENILIIENRTGEVRSIDLAEEMGFSKPSVSRAVHLLADNGYLIMESDGRLVLTKRGRDEALSVYQRHIVLTIFLKSIGVSHQTADEDACRIEHIIAEETFERIKDVLRAKEIPFPSADEKELFTYHDHYSIEHRAADEQRSQQS